MSRRAIAFFTCFLLPNVLGLSILFPAYIYPTPGNSACSGWAAIISQASANPTVPFRVIINPDSGPQSSTPNTDWQTCVPKLKAASSNMIVLGYVPTGYTTGVTAAQVKGNVSEYAAWGSAYRPDGIFFDEVSDSATLVSTYAGYASFARSSGFDFVVYNPGTNTDSGYFASADLILTFENAFSSFASASSLTISSAEPAAKQALVLYDGPTTSPTSTIDELASLGIGAVFITDFGEPNPYDKIPTAWVGEVANVAATQ